MRTYLFTLLKIGGGANMVTQISTSAGVSAARSIAENQNPGYKVVSYKLV